MKPMLPLLLICALATLPARGAEPEPFLLKDGDRVAFIGNTFVERDGQDGYIETMLLGAFPDANVSFRNLGYSADTTTGEARGLCTGWSQFEGPDQAFLRLKKLVADYKPTVLLINYGMTESFFGAAKLEEFSANYGKMLDALTTAAGTSPRVVLFSPNFHEDLGRPLPDPQEHNNNLKLYSQAIAKIAADRHLMFVDLYAVTAELASSPQAPKLTFNGIHLTHYGYWRVAQALRVTMSLPPAAWRAKLSAAGAVAQSAGLKSLEAKADNGGLNIVATPALLPPPPMPSDAPIQAKEQPAAQTQIVLQITGLKSGKYHLKSGEQVVAIGTAEQWTTGVALVNGPEAQRAEQLRKTIVAKDFDFFNYERPENDSYILAFRRGEQGRNAVEIPRFLPFVEEKEKQIATLRLPQPVTYILEAAK